MTASVQLLAPDGIPEIRPGDDLGAIIAKVLRDGDIGLQEGDVLVVTQKVVSKAEGRIVDLATITPSSAAREFAERWGKDPRQVELVLRGCDSAFESPGASSDIIQVSLQIPLSFGNGFIFVDLDLKRILRDSALCKGKRDN